MLVISIEANCTVRKQLAIFAQIFRQVLSNTRMYGNQIIAKVIKVKVESNVS